MTTPCPPNCQCSPVGCVRVLADAERVGRACRVDVLHCNSTDDQPLCHCFGRCIKHEPLEAQREAVEPDEDDMSLTNDYDREHEARYEVTEKGRAAVRTPVLLLCALAFVAGAAWCFIFLFRFIK